MNIKEWKKFSKAVDNYNQRIDEMFIAKKRRLSASSTGCFAYSGFNAMVNLSYRQIESYISKSETNFWEWKSGRLNLEYKPQEYKKKKHEIEYVYEKKRSVDLYSLIMLPFIVTLGVISIVMVILYS